MKKTILSATLLVALSAGAALAATAPGGGVVGSFHDMNTITGMNKDTQGRVCAFCHTPHHALTDVTAGQTPLWSHQFTGYVANYIPYQSATLDANITDPLMGPSRLCMSCHDGVVAADQHYGATQTSGGTNGRLSSDAFGGVAIGLASGTDANFSNDHPIGFNYNDVAAKDAGIMKSANRAFIGNPANITIADVLYQGDFMTCATCHDVHNKDNVASANAAVNYFVYAPQDGSKLCLTCHVKGSEAKN